MPDRNTTTNIDPSVQQKNQSPLNPNPHQTPRPAEFWRNGFRAGAIDVLRMVRREITDPDVTRVLDELAERYELAGGDR